MVLEIKSSVLVYKDKCLKYKKFIKTNVLNTKVYKDKCLKYIKISVLKWKTRKMKLLKKF